MKVNLPHGQNIPNAHIFLLLSIEALQSTVFGFVAYKEIDTLQVKEEVIDGSLCLPLVKFNHNVRNAIR